MQTNPNSSSPHQNSRPSLVTAKAVAAHYGIHKDTVYRWAREGRIPFHHAGTHRVRFDLAAVVEALDGLSFDRREA